jgi:hypothetical protein
VTRASLGLIVAIAACGRGAAPATGGTGQGPPVDPPADPDPGTGTADPDAKPEPAMTDTKIEWKIQPGRVGLVELGKPMPAALLGPDLEARYVARYIADAQPIDAFRFADPPLLVVLANGPYAASSAQGDPSGVPPTDRLRGQAAEVARGGALVKAVVVEAAGPTTEAGLGVGSTLDELKQAYPDLRTASFPETFGRDTCVARAKSLPGVAFVFVTCSKASKGEPAVRVDLWP